MAIPQLPGRPPGRPRGIDISGLSFRGLRENGAEYVDKSHFIETLIEDPSGAFLFPRPRRFGKSINMEMLYEFFAKENAPSEHLFEGLHIQSVWDLAGPHFRRHPTLLITLKELKASSFMEWERKLQSLLRDLMKPHEYLLPTLDRHEQVMFQSFLDEKADGVLMSRALRLLCEWLHRFHGEKVVILIDEYDAPIQEAWLLTEKALKKDPALCPGQIKPDGSTLYTEVTQFFRTFLGAAFKGNPLLYKGILTGVLELTQGSLSPDFDNPHIASVFSPHFWNAFGFTQEEVVTLFDHQKQPHRLDLARDWCNGYLFGGRALYNPLSVMTFLMEPEQPPQAFLLDTPDDTLAHYALERRALSYHDDFETLLAGVPLEVDVTGSLDMAELSISSEAFYSLLLSAGYLKAELIGLDWRGAGRYAVSIPNYEVEQLYHRTFAAWLGKLLPGGDARGVELLQRAILTGAEDQLQHILSELALTMMSFQDGSIPMPEAFYHGLLLGLCASLQGKFRVESNREAGLGRADLLIAPLQPGQPGAVLELKVAIKGKKTLKKALAEGEAQQQGRLYATALESCGAHPLHRWVVAFDGKVVKVKWVKGG